VARDVWHYGPKDDGRRPIQDGRRPGDGDLHPENRDGSNPALSGADAIRTVRAAAAPETHAPAGIGKPHHCAALKFPGFGNPLAMPYGQTHAQRERPAEEPCAYSRMNGMGYLGLSGARRHSGGGPGRSNTTNDERKGSACREVCRLHSPLP
jgi:hypothetical protein